MQRKHILLIPITLITFYLFFNMPLVSEAVIISSKLFIEKVFPSLLPMMIICDMLCYLDLPTLFANTLGKIFKKILHSSSYGPFIFFVSLFSGTPTNVYLLKKLYLSKKISLEEANKLLEFIFFTNPLFLKTMLSFVFTNHSKEILFLFILPYLSNIIIGIFSKKTKDIVDMQVIKSEDNLGSSLIRSINNAMNTLLMILGVINIFYILNALINPTNNVLFAGLLELTTGLYRLGVTDLNLDMKMFIAIIFINFGGLSIHLQVKGILSETDINYKSFFKGRLKAIVISLFFFFLLY